MANGVKLHAGRAAVAINRRARTVTDALGAIHPYDDLIIATGSRPAFPPVSGLRRPDGRLTPGVFGFRSLEDCEAMVAWARDARRVVVVGGGLLGLEAGRGLVERGLDVEIVHRADRLMNLQLDAEAAAMLRESVEELGMRVRLNASAERLIGEERVQGVELADGTRLACEMVVFATGIRPNAELAARAGLRVERAIVVDDTLSAVGCDHVYAIGECAQHRGDVPGLWAPAWEQARVLADRVTGADPGAQYHGSKPATKLKVSGVQLATMGIVEPDDERDEVVRYSEPRRRIYKSVIIRDGRIAGAILLGDLAGAASLTQALDNATVLPEERAALLFDLRARRRATASTSWGWTPRCASATGSAKETSTRASATGSERCRRCPQRRVPEPGAARAETASSKSSNGRPARPHEVGTALHVELTGDPHWYSSKHSIAGFGTTLSERRGYSWHHRVASEIVTPALQG